MSGEAKVAYGQITYAKEFDNTVKCLDLVTPYVDWAVIVGDESLTEEMKQKIQSYPNAVLKIEKWEDNFPKHRNQYLEEAKRLGADWMLVSDSDEFFNEQFLKDLHRVVQQAEDKAVDMCGINCHEQFEAVEWLDDLDLMKESPGGYKESDFYKNLLFKLYPDLSYEGVGVTGSVHETTNRKQWRPINLPKDKYWYEHVKSSLKIWERAAANFFAGGGGDNVGELNPHWQPFRELCEKHGIETSQQLVEALETKIPQEMEDKLTEFLKVEPTDWGTEMREAAKLYYIHHPERKTEEVEKLLKNPPAKSEKTLTEEFVRRVYFQTLGRHPDRQGLEFYANAILTGKITKEQFPGVLMQSPEYRQKFAEQVRVQVPVDVNVNVDERTYLDAFMKSSLFRESFKPRWDVGKVVEQLIDDSKGFYKEFYQQLNMGGMTSDRFIELFTKFARKEEQ